MSFETGLGVVQELWFLSSEGKVMPEKQTGFYTQKLANSAEHLER